MIFKNEHIASLGPKLFLMVVVSLTVLVSGVLMFADVSKLSSWLGTYELQGDSLRRVVLLSCLIIYLLRLLVTTFVFLKRRMTWPETMIISFLIPLALYMYARVGGGNDRAIGVIEIIGIAMYLLGSWLNSRSEYTRHMFKQKETNQGRLYTEGLFKHSMHINYFGDIVLFTGLSLIAHSFTILVIPLVMTLNFVFFIIPTLDKHLAQKYGDQFTEYAEHTKKFIPKIY